MLPNYGKFPNRNVQTFGLVHLGTNGLNHGPVWNPLERNLYRDPLAGLLWERQFEKVPLEHGWEKVLNWECLLVNPEQVLFLSVCGRYNIGWTQDISPTWKIIMKGVDLGEPTSFLDHVYLCCTQRECQLWIITKVCFESWISAGAVEKLPEPKAPGKPETNTFSSWSYDMERHAKKCLDRYFELANKTTEQLHKHLLHATMTIISKRED